MSYDRRTLIGRTLSHFKITSKLGEGGMGEVFLAEDTRLDRKVALKVLPEGLAADAERLERFEREAKTVAALNHPNIVTLYSVEADEGRQFLTMELIDGETLDHHIPARGLSVARLLELAIPIADGLAEAHAQGITHRDLKPANVMVNAKGQIKILDFGLAKLALSEPVSESAETAALTQEGLAIGTARYMSPEQASGRPADHRSDVFSLGVLLYEMAVGHRPFDGKTSIELLSSILKDDPPSVTEIRDELPTHLGRIIRRCLEKQPNQRYQSALEVRNELRNLAKELGSQLSGSSGPRTAAASSSKPVRKAIIRALLVTALAAGIWWTSRLDEGQSDEGLQTTEPATSAEVTVASAAAEERDASIAVLPFVQRGVAQNTDYFVDGVHDDLLTQLASIPDLKVISRTSVLEYRNTTKNMRQIGQELGVGHLLEGSVQRAGERVRINVKLIDAAADQQRWSETYDRDLTPENILAIQTEIADAIATALERTLSGRSAPALARAPTRSQEAYDLYQQARAISSDSASEELSRAIELAKKAVDLDPEFALAMGEISRGYTALYWFSVKLPEHCDAARLWIDRALALAPDDPRLQFEQSVFWYHCHLDYEAALEALDSAQRGLPGASRLYEVRGAILRRRGDFDASFAAYEKALLLDPRDVFSLAHHIFTYMVVGDVQGARRIAERVRGFPGASDLHLSFTHLIDLHLLGDTTPMAEFLNDRPEVELGPLAEIPFLIPLLERRYEDLELLLETAPNPIRAQFTVWPHSFLRARMLHAQKRVDAAREQAEQAVAELSAIATATQNDPGVIIDRALMQAILGDESTARSEARRAKDLYPIEKDAMRGPDYVADELRALAVFVDAEELVEKLEAYLALESKQQHVDYLLLQPEFDRHRDHPAIQALREQYSLRTARP